MSTFYPSPLTTIIQYLSNTGVPLNGGLVNLYNAGTTTPLSSGSWTDITGTTLNANPIVLSASGRPVSSSGAPVGIYIVAGTYHKAVITDASGNVLAGGNSLDWLLGIGDPTYVTSSFASVTATGPAGAGVDLVGNATKSWQTFTQMRAAAIAGVFNGAGTGQALMATVEGGTSAGDGLGGLFYWAPASTAADDGVNTIKVTAITIGRWIRVSMPSYASGTYTATLTGMTGSTTGTMNYTYYGNVVALYNNANIYGTSNTTAMTMTGMPVAIQPTAGSPTVPCIVTDSVAGESIGYMQMTGSTATFSLGIAVGGTFTASGSKGLPKGFCCVYTLF